MAFGSFIGRYGGFFRTRTRDNAAVAERYLQGLAQAEEATFAAMATVVEQGCDFVSIGRAAILRHDFPIRVQADASYDSPPLPVSVEHLLDEGLTPPCIEYMNSWPGFVAEPEKSA